MIVIANVFAKLQTVKILLRSLSEKHPFRTRLDSQHVKTFQIIAKSPWQDFCHVFSSFLRKLICKMSPLVLGEIFGVSINEVTADGKYFVQDCDNLPLPNEMQLSGK